MAEGGQPGRRRRRATWCRAAGIPLQRRPPAPAHAARRRRPSLQFTETMRGFIAPAADFQPGFDAGKQQNTKLDVRLTIRTDDVDAFVMDPTHKAERHRHGRFAAPRRQGPGVERRVQPARVRTPIRARRRCATACSSTDAGGAPHTIIGFKKVEDNGTPAEVFGDTTILYTTLYRGHHPTPTETPADRKAIGIITIHFARLPRADDDVPHRGPTLAARTARARRGSGLFLGKLTDVYGGFLLGRRLAMADADVIVIGIGFGGAVTACRLAQAGASVLVLERGREWKVDRLSARSPTIRGCAIRTRRRSGTAGSTSACSRT